MSLENVNDSGRQNPGYETQKGGSAAYGSGFPKILFSRVSNLGFHEKLSNEEIQTFLLLRHLPKPGEEKSPQWLSRLGNFAVRCRTLSYFEDENLEERPFLGRKPVWLRDGRFG